RLAKRSVVSKRPPLLRDDHEGGQDAQSDRALSAWMAKATAAHCRGARPDRGTPALAGPGLPELSAGDQDTRPGEQFPLAELRAVRAVLSLRHALRAIPAPGTIRQSGEHSLWIHFLHYSGPVRRYQPE